MSNLAQTSHDAFHAADKAGGLETVLRFMRSQPEGFKCTRDDIAAGTRLKLQTVCGRVADALDIEKHNPPLLAEDGSVRDGKKLVSLNTTPEALIREDTSDSEHGTDITGTVAMFGPAEEREEPPKQSRRMGLAEDHESYSRAGHANGNRKSWCADGPSRTEQISSAASRTTVRAPSPDSSLDGNHSAAGDSAFSTPESTAPAPAAFSNHGQAESVTVAGAVDTGSEEYRHRCEINYVVNLASDSARRMFLEGVREKRGNEAWKRLRGDVWNAMSNHAAR